MAKRMKMPRGFYNEFKSYDMPREKIKAIEFWLEHNSDPSKDIRFYVYWRKHDELIKGWDYLGAIDKQDFNEHTLIRYINYPRTRRQKAIHRSIMSGLRHLSEIS